MPPDGAGIPPPGGGRVVRGIRVPPDGTGIPRTEMVSRYAAQPRVARPRGVRGTQVAPAALPGSQGGEDPEEQARVVHRSVRTASRTSSRGRPAHRHTQLLAGPHVPLLLGDGGEVTGEEDAQRLGRAARRGDVVDEDVPRTGGAVGLLAELPGGRLVRRLSVDVEQPGRDLPLVAPAGWRYCWMRQRPGPRRRGRGRRPRRGGRRYSRVRPRRPRRGRRSPRRRPRSARGKQPGGRRVAGLDPVGQRLGSTTSGRGRSTLPGQLGRGCAGHRVACASACTCSGRSTSTSREAALAPRWRRPTSPANSGWARVGRDLNSGCAWVET